MSLSRRRALVTGANGFIGAALTLRLVSEGVAVRAMCRNPAKGSFLVGAEVIQGDVQDLATVRRLAEGCDLVFHVAAIGDGPAADHYSINVRGAENVARAAADTGAERLIHVSSVAIYGLNVIGQVFESQPSNPSSRYFYAQSKALGEAAVWRVGSEQRLPTTVVRPAFVYGPRSEGWTVRMYELCHRLPFVPEFKG